MYKFKEKWDSNKHKYDCILVGRFSNSHKIFSMWSIKDNKQAVRIWESFNEVELENGGRVEFYAYVQVSDGTKSQ